jgi:hypothetical protein
LISRKATEWLSVRSQAPQATVVACLLIIRKDGKVQKQMRTFGTTTRELLNLREWVLSQDCTHAAMESTGVYFQRPFGRAWRRAQSGSFVERHVNVS